MDVARTEMVEAELNAFISKRDAQRRKDEGERQLEEAYLESCRVHAQQEYERELWEKLHYHRRMVRTHTANLEAIIGRHRLEVERCATLLGIDDQEEGEAA